MSKFFIHRPIFAIVISLIIVIGGLISAFQLPIAQYPQIAPPTVSVSTTYTGANAKVVNETVAQVIEQQVNGVQGMDYMNSNASDSGYYSLSVVFELGTDGDMDAVKVQNAVAVANPTLPDTVKTVGVVTSKSSNTMALMAALVSPEGTFDRTWIKNYSDIYLIDRIKRVDGVGSVQAFGADHALRIWLNPDRLAEMNLTVSDITDAINEQNLQAPAGTVGALPIRDQQEKQFTGKIDGRLVTAEEFGNIVIKRDKNGSMVHLKDVARVEKGAKQYAVFANMNGAPNTVAFGIQLTEDANTMTTVAEVRKILEEAEKSFPPDLKLQYIVDTTDFIGSSIKEVVETFVEALLLVVLVVFIFLQNWRATLIPLLAVPVSLIGTFIAFIILGFSINTLTLFAMVLAIGLVVDDAIVVIENVEHHMSTGLTPIDATERAMDEVQGPVVAIAFVLAAVFIPVAFLGGMMGVLYRQFALTIAISMALSAFVALTLTPALCAMILKPVDYDAKKEKDSNILDRFFKKFNDKFNEIRIGYQGVVGWFIGNAKYAVILIVIITGLTGLLYKIVPSTFVPDEDQGYYAVSVSLPEGTSINQTSITMDNVSTAIKGMEGIENVISITGFDIFSFGTKSNAGTMFIGLKNWDERTTPDLSINALINKTFGIGAKVAPEAQVVAFNMPALPGLGNVGGWQMELQDLAGHTDEELNEVSQKIVAAANQRPELQGVRSTFKVNSPIVQYDIDRDKAKSLGVKLSDIFNTMQVFYGGNQINDFNEFGRSYKVMVQADKLYRTAAEDMRFMFVRNSSNEMIPLESLLTPKMSTAPSIVHRFNASKAVSFQGNAASGYSSGQAIAAMEEIVNEIAPNGYHIEWSGQAREEIKSGDSTGTVLALALIFVFLCLAALYESWSVPFAVIFCVPVGIFGALFSELAISMLETLTVGPNAGLQNSVYMQIGVIMLIGLSAKNAILIVEFAKARADMGMNPLKAAIEAAGLRLRPILMTSFAFIIGCLPLAVASGAGAAARNGMGVAVVGGMLFATFIGIFIIPSFYIITVRFADMVGWNKKKKKEHDKKFV
ncbi:efflux RND transporter permease subunit [Anaerovibrio lipolyticus]|uniref:efflux RND transporter permease subunit n=1 Tax=Anaerovibrio lipolyticus TaxID=82374 RepID=UPI0026F33B9F|nr:multidrug efflux RND transporter permease subunit [Anaerovibrio lipolyticus]MBE6106144.1 multidrug efflux RND transporter permease subunit [Anaerovibrio lipolyticus]